MTDPTREDLIALLSENLTWRSPTPEGPRAMISPQWVERVADAILARLRRACEGDELVKAFGTFRRDVLVVLIAMCASYAIYVIWMTDGFGLWASR